MTEELRKTFHEELESIKNGIIRMAGRVSEAIVRGTDAFLAGDMAEAESLIGNDDVIDAMSIELEERCYQVLALQQPMASDLRAITGALWINGEIERCGDLMSNICKAAELGGECRGRGAPPCATHHAPCTMHHMRITYAAFT